jgi:hypothetical protein
MAVYTELIKNVSYLNVKSAVDSRIYTACRVVAGKKSLPFRVRYNTSRSWKYGVDTQGLNNISRNRGIYMKTYDKHYIKTDLVLDNCIPKEIANKLRECKKYCKSDFVGK